MYRRASLGDPYAFAVSTTGTSTTDTGLSPNTTYLYKVRAVNSSGPGDFSAVDAATTTVFDDTSLGGVAIKAVHVTQLRTAVGAMRAAAQLPVFGFTDPALAAGMPVLRQHVIDLRTALDGARSTLGLPAMVYTDQVITAGSTVIKAPHITELRAGDTIDRLPGPRNAALAIVLLN